MKKALSLLLSLLLLFGITSTAFAAEANGVGTQIPIILVGGDGDALYDADGNKIFKITELENAVSGTEEGNFYDALANIMLPFILEGIMTNKWDKYYENLQAELTEMFSDILPNEDGEVVDGSGISQAHKDDLEYSRHHDKKGAKGYYGINDYRFWYDWRLDPCAIADDLYLYIQDVKAATGSSEVSLVGRCIGSDVVLAYIAKYGTEGIHGVGIGATVVNGAEMISEAISGKFELDGNAISRFCTDMNDTGYMAIGSYLTTTLDLLQQSGALNYITDDFKTKIYYNIVKGATSALALSTFCAMPCYWSLVTAEDYDDAMEYVFGDEDSEKRVKYAKLIEKIENYNTLVRSNLTNLMTSINDNCNLGITSKYGRQILPICQSNDVVSDQFASVTRSSFGATTSDIYTTLSDEYIENQTALGLGKYISPDKQVDASTCMFPDQTWFIKGANHSNWTPLENGILVAVVSADHQLTIDDFDFSQFLVYSYETGVVESMTEENCHTESWSTHKEDYEPTSKFGRLFNFIKALLKWLSTMIKLITSKIN